MRTKGWFILLVFVLAAGVLGWRISRKPDGPVFRTAEVERGDLDISISATGTIEPEEVVDVGAQVAGRIISFGTDEQGKVIDYGSEVKEGTILARIDEALYASDVAQARAALERTQADLLQSQAKYAQAERDWTRAQKLGPSDALAHSSYDAYRAGFEAAKAGVAVSQASVDQARATLARAEQNLGYCVIQSPVNGVIIDRRVNIGQTVVASLNAPSLFLIAKDLKRMQVWVAVNEADIGNIVPGQRTTFTVDAFPGQVFEGHVSKTRLNATMTQNVVTYTVEVFTDNSTGKLLPYLTANVSFEVAKKDNVLLVPNAALRWKPRPELIANDKGANPRRTGGEDRGRLWLSGDAPLHAVSVRVGQSDGTLTEVEGEEIKEGMQVIIGEEQETAKPEQKTASPFTPQVIRGGRR